LPLAKTGFHTVSTSQRAKRVPKVVLDTNVWLSALLWGGKPAEIIKAAEDGKFIVVTSEEIIREINQVLNYPRFRKIYEAEGLCHEDLLESVLKIVKFVNVTKRVKVVIDHAADNKFVECALAADSDYIVSGDKHVPKVGSYKKIKIVSVTEFLEAITAK